MKRLTQLILPLLMSWMLLLNHAPLRAQTPSIDSLLTRALETDVLLPMLIDSAILHSAELRRSGGYIDYAKESLQINKKAIFSAVSAGTSYNYGTNFSAVNNPAGASNINNFTTAQTGFYNVGIGLQLPLTHVINRKHLIREGKALVDAAVADKENTSLLIKQNVITLYQEFKLLQKMVVISSKVKQSAMVNNTLAEKDFLNSQLTVDQLSIVQEKLNQSTINLETYINKFQTSYMQLEAFTGTNLSTLLMSVK